MDNPETGKKKITTNKLLFIHVGDNTAIKATVLPMTKKYTYAVLNGHIFVIVRVRYIKVYIFKKRRN